MTPEEEIRANAAVRTVQYSLEMMMNRCISLECEMEARGAVIVGLEKQLADLKASSGEA